MKKLTLSMMIFFLLAGRLSAAVLNLQPGKWLFVTKAVEGPSSYDFDFLAAVVASSALTDGYPAVLSITNETCLVNDAWHADYINRYHPSKALVIGQDMPFVSGVSQLIVLNSASAGVEQAKVIATNVWQSSDQAVVCSGSDYTNALVAASLAARLRVPLLFSSTSGDLDAVLGQLNVQSALVVGFPVTLPVSSTTLSGPVAVISWLRTNGYPVNYLAAVNAADRAANPDGSKFSLISVIVAARRGGVVVPVQDTSTYITAGAELEQLYASIDTDYYPEYLLISGTPTWFPLGEMNGLSTSEYWTNLVTDATYANIDEDTFLEIAVGRLIANNFSEGSLIASRISTYDSLKDGNWENRYAEMGRWGIFESGAVLQNSGFSGDDLLGEVHNDSPPIEDGVILHSDHSWWYGLGVAFEVDNLNTLLAPAFIISKGCSTAALDMDTKQITKNLFRQGAVGFMGGPRELQGMATFMVSEVINSITQFEPLGHAYRRAFEAVSLNVLDNDDHGSNVTRYNWIVLGDPALVLHVPDMPTEEPAVMDLSSDNKTLTVTSPETWWILPHRDAQLIEWNWYPNTLHVAIGAGTSLMGYWGAPGYDHEIPYFIAKYQTAGLVQTMTQQTGIPTPLGWYGDFANNVHVDEHADGTRTYLWRVRMMDFDHENGGSINSVISTVSYAINNDNLIQNGSFETGNTWPDSWIQDTGATWSSTNPQDGGKSLQVTGDVGAVRQDVMVTNGVTYTLSLWVNAAGLTGGQAIFDSWDDYDGPGGCQFVINDVNDANGWTQKTGTFMATNTAPVRFRVFSDAVFAGSVYFDNISLTVAGNYNRAPVWNDSPVVKLNGQDTVAYSGSLYADASDPDGDPVIFTKTGGASWLTVDLNGALRGTPDVEGTNTATVTVSDGVNPAVPVTVQITVDAAPAADTAAPIPNPMTWAVAPAPVAAGPLDVLTAAALAGNNPATGAPWTAEDTYRLAFVTSGTRDATPTDINVYNSFVQAAADIAGFGNATWKVIGSTGTVDAKDNTSSNPSVNGTGEAIFLVDGSTLVANNYADLWDGSIDHAINIDENGTSGVAVNPATGSEVSGTARDRHLGGSDEVPSLIEYGDTTKTVSTWILIFNGLTTGSYHYYALSDPLTIGGDPTSQITMTAATAFDPSGVEYYFDETSGNPGGTDSGWQDSPVYTDVGLSTGYEYTYTVTVRDKSAAQNTTAASTPVSVVLTLPDTTAPTPDPMTWEIAPVSGNQGSVLGSYNRLPIENSWHEGRIIPGTETELAWSNEAGVVWNLIPDYPNQKLLTDDTCPYPGNNFTISITNGTVNGFYFLGQLYSQIETDDVQISMTASPASDPSGVEYYFDETSGNPGGTDSGWQDSSAYVDTDLEPGTEYTYIVIVRDKSPAHNITAPSAASSATTEGDGVLEGYDAWAASNSVGAATADDDGDGRENLLEYSIGGDPNSTGDTGVDPVLVKITDAFEYSYDKRNDDPNLTFTVQVCTNLTANGWADSGIGPVTNSTDGVYDNVKHTIPADQVQKYIRLKVTNQ